MRHEGLGTIRAAAVSRDGGALCRDPRRGGFRPGGRSLPLHGPAGRLGARGRRRRHLDGSSRRRPLQSREHGWRSRHLGRLERARHAGLPVRLHGRWREFRGRPRGCRGGEPSACRHHRLGRHRTRPRSAGCRGPGPRHPVGGRRPQGGALRGIGPRRLCHVHGWRPGLGRTRDEGRAAHPTRSARRRAAGSFGPVLPLQEHPGRPGQHPVRDRQAGQRRLRTRPSRKR